jgi:DNA-directed RNA polymerase specialized sigma24 family protein
MSRGPSLDSKPLDIDWGQFFELYRPLALRVARGIVAQRDDEEEVVQEAARSVFERASAGELALESVAHARL